MSQFPASMKAALIAAIAQMTEAEAIRLWESVGEHAENLCCGLDEMPEPSTAAEERVQKIERERLAALEKLAEAGNVYMADHARAPGDPQGDLHLPADTCANCECTHGPDHTGPCECALQMPKVWAQHSYVTPACLACGSAS